MFPRHTKATVISSTPASIISFGALNIVARFWSMALDTRLKEIIEQTATELQADVIELEVMPDHVHLLGEVDPQFGIHKLVKRIKGRSSRLLRQEFSWLKSRLPTLWTNSYFISTVGGAPLAVVKQYIEQQKDR